jgi:AcrR family transcriptional regulator
MSPRPRIITLQGDLEHAITETAWRHIAEHGAPALSLRAIARDLDITAPAIYNYYPNRDELVTALIIEAYTSFGDWQVASRDAAPAGDLPGQLLAIGQAYRQWAITYPQRYILIFGMPVPGYQPPAERIQPAGMRAFSVIVGTVEALRQAGRLRLDEAPSVPPENLAPLHTWKPTGLPPFEMASFSIALRIWARVHGLVWLEITGNLPPFGPSAADLYARELEAVRDQFLTLA